MKHNRLKIGFVMDPMDKLYYRFDTSLTLMREAERRGHAVFYIEPKDIFYVEDTVWGDAREVKSPKNKRPEVLGYSTIDLRDLDVIFIRKEPPFDELYLHTTQLLELIEKDVFIINSPRGIRKANEKLYILNWPKWIPPTLVTNHAKQIELFCQEIQGDVILKPLDQKGGKGVRLLKWRGTNLRRIMGQATSGGKRTVMAQKYIMKGRTLGDKRVLLLNGEILGQFRRTPKKGEYRANLSIGGTAHTTSLTVKERALVRDLKPRLLQDGLYFVGVDLVDGQLIEINVTSPAGIWDLTALDDSHLEIQVLNFLEAKSRS